jgi:hypothetical protein
MYDYTAAQLKLMYPPTAWLTYYDNASSYCVNILIQAVFFLASQLIASSGGLARTFACARLLMISSSARWAPVMSERVAGRRAGCLVMSDGGCLACLGGVSLSAGCLGVVTSSVVGTFWLRWPYLKKQTDDTTACSSVGRLLLLLLLLLLLFVF